MFLYYPVCAFKINSKTFHWFIIFPGQKIIIDVIEAKIFYSVKMEFSICSHFAIYQSCLYLCGYFIRGINKSVVQNLTIYMPLVMDYIKKNKAAISSTKSCNKDDGFHDFCQFPIFSKNNAFQTNFLGTPCKYFFNKN